MKLFVEEKNCIKIFVSYLVLHIFTPNEIPTNRNLYYISDLLQIVVEVDGNGLCLQKTVVCVTHCIVPNHCSLTRYKNNLTTGRYLRMLDVNNLIKLLFFLLFYNVRS